MSWKLEITRSGHKIRGKHTFYIVCSLNRYAAMGIYCFTLKTVIIDMMLLLFTEFKNKKKCNIVLLMLLLHIFIRVSFAFYFKICI